MKKILIIDDEPFVRSVVLKYLSQWDLFEIMGECANSYEGLKSIETLKPDLIFLDIQIPKINGFEMLKLVDYPVSVIFTTAHDEFALKAFEISAVDYLLKPFSQERFNQAMEKWEKQANPGNNQVSLSELTEQPD